MRTLIASAALLIVLGSPAVPAQTAQFIVALRGQQVGQAVYRITARGSVLHSQSTVQLSSTGVDYSLSKNEELSQTHQFQSADLNAVVNGTAVHLVTSAAQSGVEMKVSANGQSSSAQLAAHPNTVLVPDFDPGGLQTLITLATRGDHAPLWLLIPRQAGVVDPVTVTTQTDEHGTLDGRPIVVHHLTATCDHASTELFTDDHYRLVQAELPQAGFALVLQNFQLMPPAHAPAAPPANGDTPPTSQSQQ